MVSWESSRTNRTSILPSRLEVRGFVWRRCYLGVLKADTSYILSLHHQKSLLSNITVLSMKNTVTPPVAVNCGHRDQLVKSILQIDSPIMNLDRVYIRVKEMYQTLLNLMTHLVQLLWFCVSPVCSNIATLANQFCQSSPSPE